MGLKFSLLLPNGDVKPYGTWSWFNHQVKRIKAVTVRQSRLAPEDFKISVLLDDATVFEIDGLHAMDLRQFFRRNALTGLPIAILCKSGFGRGIFTLGPGKYDHRRRVMNKLADIPAGVRFFDWDTFLSLGYFTRLDSTYPKGKV